MGSRSRAAAKQPWKRCCYFPETNLKGKGDVKELKAADGSLVRCLWIADLRETLRGPTRMRGLLEPTQNPEASRKEIPPPISNLSPGL